jgi:UDP-glucose 4-epimerase
LNVLEAARKHGVNKVIFASSGGTIYGEVGKVPPTETAPGNPISPYGITKYTVEYYLNFYNLVHGLKFTILRYANVYGPRQDPHGEAGVVSIFTGKMLANEDLVIFGDGKQTRDYVFVADVVAANLAALTKGDNQIINIGTERATSVNKLFDIMTGVAQYKRKPVYKPARAGELGRSLLNPSKAKKLLNWEPKVSLEEGLQLTIGYFRNEIK